MGLSRRSFAVAQYGHLRFAGQPSRFRGFAFRALHFFHRASIGSQSTSRGAQPWGCAQALEIDGNAGSGRVRLVRFRT